MQRLKSLCYKLYLSLQTLILITGLGFFLFHLGAAVHDFYMSEKAKECIQGAMIIKISNLSEWFSEVAIGHPADKYLAKENIDKHCSDYVSVFHSRWDGDITFRIRNWYGSSPAQFLDRALCVFASAFFAALAMLALFALMKWTSWLSKE